MEGNGCDLECNGGQDEHQGQSSQRCGAGLQSQADGVEAGAAAQAVQQGRAVQENSSGCRSHEQIFECCFRAAGIPLHVARQQIAGDGERFQRDEHTHQIRCPAKEHGAEGCGEEDGGVLANGCAALLRVTPADQQRQKRGQGNHSPERHRQVVGEEGSKERGLQRCVPLQGE